MRKVMIILALLLSPQLFAAEAVPVDEVPVDAVKLLEFQRPESRHIVYVKRTVTQRQLAETCQQIEAGEIEVLKTTAISKNYNEYTYANAKGGLSKVGCNSEPVVNLSFYQCDDGDCVQFIGSHGRDSFRATSFKYDVNRYMAGLFDGLLGFEYLFQTARGRARDSNANILESYRTQLNNAAEALIKGKDFEWILIRRSSQTAVDYFMLNLLGPEPAFPSR